MTIVDFEKLVEKDPKRDEILNRVKTGVGVLNNDEEWYDICAEQYNLCNKNIESFFYNLYRILDFYRIKQANFKVIEKNDALFLKKFENIHSKIAEYVELHPIEKAKNNDYKERLINDIAIIVFNDFFEPLTLLEHRRKHLKEVISLWEMAEKWNGTYELDKISFTLNKDGGSYKITEDKTINLLKDAICNKIPWLTPHEYLIDGKKLNKTKINNDIDKIKNYDTHHYSRLRNHLIYEIFLVFVYFEFVDTTDTNEYNIKTKNGECAVLNTTNAVWIYDLIDLLGIFKAANKGKREAMNEKETEGKKDYIKDAIKDQNARHKLDLPIDTYRREYTGRFTKYTEIIPSPIPL
ncbi:MAG: hypothetical protein IJX41_07655 [Bacteroidaceae bacterium]|nr:hypothetical protein [Bacteroidaceae bacterium]